MYPIALVLHNVVRWIVLAAALAVIARAATGLASGRVWSKVDRIVSLAFVASLDVQAVLGVLLFAVLSPSLGLAAATSDPVARRFSFEHVAPMLVSLVLAHVGQVLVRRAPTDRSKRVRSLAYFGLSFLAILVAIPWGKPFLPGL